MLIHRYGKLSQQVEDPRFWLNPTQENQANAITSEHPGFDLITSFDFNSAMPCACIHTHPYASTIAQRVLEIYLKKIQRVK